MTTLTKDQLEAGARAILTHEDGERRLRICRGPAPCMPEPCSCTRNLYPLVEAVLTAGRSALAQAQNKDGRS